MVTPIHIEVVRPNEEDISEILQLHQSIAREHVSFHPIDLRELVCEIASDLDPASERIFMIALFHNEIVGTVSARIERQGFQSSMVLQITSLCVKRGFRRIGVGTRLVREMQQAAQHVGVKSVGLYADSRNYAINKLCERLNFTTSPVTYVQLEAPCASTT